MLPGTVFGPDYREKTPNHFVFLMFFSWMNQWSMERFSRKL